ncbi:MAG: hypothetical protein KKF44_08740 [Nanoarchaeota archaeon]|nr:hypothetical protein [Nanoarchaeota archaeon]
MSPFYINKDSKALLDPIFSVLSSLSVLVIGDTIIDHYIFALPKGRAVKDPILSVEFKYQEKYAGGILAIANHISSYVKEIKLVTLVGAKKSNIDFIKKSMGQNIHLQTFFKPSSPTTVKKRYIDSYRNHKLFKIEYMDDRLIRPELTKEICEYLSQEIPKHDLVLVGDFGHGFLNQEIRSVIENKSKFLSINVQSNSANMGYNYVNHYKHPDFMTMDEQEVRLPLMKRFDDIENVIRDFHSTFGHQKFLVTLGKKGVLYYNEGKIHHAPILITDVVDTVGAGDAVFALSSLFVYTNAGNDLILFIANCAGGIKSNIMGNKESVTKEKLIKFIEELHNELE